MNNPNIPPFEPDDTISRIQQVRVYIYNTINNLIELGMDLLGISQFYTSQTANVTTSELSLIYDVMTGNAGNIFSVNDVPLNLPIPPYAMDVFAVPHDTNFRYIGEVVKYDMDTGEVSTERFIYDTDELLSRQIAADKLLDFVLDKYSEHSNLAFSGVNIIQVYRNI